MDALLARGFLNWDKRDFLKFKQALELYPREDVDDIAGHIGTKTREEIQAYQAVFYANVDTLNEAAKIKKVLERCTGIHNFKKSAPLLIKTKVTAVERPLDEMVINPIQKSKYFSKEAEIVLLCLTHEHGYGNWTEIKHAIRRDPRVRFDHLLMSRSEVELQRRVDILVKTIEKEIEQESIQVKKPKTLVTADIEMKSNSDQSDASEDEPMDTNNNQEGMSDDEDDYAQIRLGINECSDNTHGRAEVVNEAVDEIGVDEFEGLEEAAQAVLKKPRLY